ncbi:hypothetical protein B0H11DRAFT_1907828 [Mycena galericulata]|nr:hypothetical protein B0H11DRAFT_1907828 [Mycena galericulata]
MYIHPSGIFAQPAGGAGRGACGEPKRYSGTTETGNERGHRPGVRAEIERFRRTVAPVAGQKRAEKAYNVSREHPEHPRSGLERCAGGSQRGTAEPKPSREAATEQIWDSKEFLAFWQAGTSSGERGGPNEEAEVKKSPIITGTNNAIPSPLRYITTLAAPQADTQRA